MVGTTRRTLLGGMAGMAAMSAAGTTARAAPASPIALNIVDVGGQLQLTQRALESYWRARPDTVSRMNFSQAPAPELPGKLQAQQNAGRVDIDLVLGGVDIISNGVDLGIWTKLFPDHASSLPDLQTLLLPAAYDMQKLAQGQAVCVVFCPGGPLLEYMPDRVKQPPATAEDLLAWTRANKNRFLYARPANSGPGRAFLMGMPYILGDSDPKDPAGGWAKTWSYLAELGKNIEYYPTGTSATMKELAEGSRDMVASHVGWDINPRALGVVPKEAQIATLKGFHFVTDAQYMTIPKGIAADRIPVLLDVVNYMLTKPAQAMTYDKGYFYPGPSVRDVPLSLAPAESQKVIEEFGRGDFYTKLFAETPMDTQLEAKKLVYAFERWDKEIGAKVGK
ncbi:MAG TPA: extracellular solute-binding protein [Acidisphaera sp.]|nr:extracellular solute-binding protein [Acidisphaera sp.]